MGFGIHVGVLSLIQLPTLSEYPFSLTSRFFLNLRSVASQQSQTTTESHRMSSAISAIRTRRTWKQPRPPAANHFVESQLDNTIHCSENYTAERDIQETEVLDLDVRESQTQHNSDKHNLGTKNDIDE